MNQIPPILEVGGVLISSDLITEYFCCDLAVCKGACCIEGDAGAPVSLDEIGEIEQVLDEVWPDLSASAQAVIDKQGVAYTDQEGDLVTSIVGGKDCVFTCYDDIEVDGAPVHHCCLCALERAAALHPSCVPSVASEQSSSAPFTLHQFIKPISCALYPIREKVFSDGTVALDYHQWDICRCGREKGKALHLPVYQFLKGPLIRRFGEAWYQELCDVAEVLNSPNHP